MTRHVGIYGQSDLHIYMVHLITKLILQVMMPVMLTAYLYQECMAKSSFIFVVHKFGMHLNPPFTEQGN